MRWKPSWQAPRPSSRSVRATPTGEEEEALLPRREADGDATVLLMMATVGGHACLSASCACRYLLWLSVSQVLPPGVQCMTDRLVPLYDAHNNSWHNKPGVSIRQAHQRAG